LKVQGELTLRTMTVRVREWIERRVDERHGWALKESHEEVNALKTQLEEEQYNFLLEKERLAIRSKKQRCKDKEALEQLEGRHGRLVHDLVVAAELSDKSLERQLRVETSEADKARAHCVVFGTEREKRFANVIGFEG
jgi:hypothetical protein